MRELDFEQAFIGPDLQSQDLNKQKFSNFVYLKKDFCAIHDLLLPNILKELLGPLRQFSCNAQRNVFQDNSSIKFQFTKSSFASAME